MEKMYYYFDESGKKGFVRPGFKKTDIGLLAGVAFPSRCIPNFEPNFKKILSKLETSSVDKVHSTELFNVESNRNVREELLEYLSNEDEWLLIYEAIYPLGLYNHEQSLVAIMAVHKPENPRVKVSKNLSKTRIYNSLLEGLIIKLDETCKIEDSSELVMVSDHIDSGLHKEALATLGYHQQEEHRSTITGFDTVDKKVVSKDILTKVESVDISVKHVTTIEVDSTCSPMTVVADIITNTLYHHLCKQAEQKDSPKLHSMNALECYALAHKAAFVGDDYILDNLYSPHTKG